MWTGSRSFTIGSQRRTCPRQGDSSAGWPRSSRGRRTPAAVDVASNVCRGRGGRRCGTVDSEVDGGIVGEEEGKAVDGEVDSDTVDDEVDDEVDRLVAGAVVGAVLCEEVIGCCTFV